MTLRKKLILAFFLIAFAPTATLRILASLHSFSEAEQRAREDLALTLGILSGTIHRELQSAAVLLHREAVELVLDPESMSRAQLQEAAANNSVVARVFSRTPHAARRLYLFQSRLDEALILEGRYRNLPAQVVVTGSWSSKDSGVPAGIRSLAEAARDSATGLEIRTVFEPTGAVLALAVPWPTPGSGRPGALVEEYALPPLLEDITGEVDDCEVSECFAGFQGERAGSWRFLYHMDPTRIGLEVGADVLIPSAGGGARVAENARPSAAFAGPGSPGRWDMVRKGDNLTAAGVDPSTGWLLGGTISLTPYLAPVRAGSRIAFLLLFLMTCLVSVGIFFVTRGIGRAVHDIAASAAAIARGDFHGTVRTRRSDEFGAIAGHLEEMAHELALTAESRSIARLSSRLVHALKGVASQMSLLLYNLRENYEDPEFRAEFPSLMEQLVRQVETLTLQLKRGRADDEMRIERVDLDALVARVLEGRSRTWPPGIRVECQLRAGSPVASNEELLVSIIESLATNAVEAMEGGGVLTVRTGAVDAAPRGRSKQAPTHFVEIEDTGRGMTREFIENQLFQPFVTTKDKGLGLGMYYVRRDVTRLGGTIHVDSRPGRRTCVRVEVGLHEDHPDR